LEFTDEELASESEEFVYAAFDEGDLVGTLNYVVLPGGVFKMRQVAVDPRSQGRGVGRLLVEASEVSLGGKGGLEIVLNARDTAVPFYQALGYETVGEPFEEVGIPHRKMKKRLL
jgi:predicted GNAT family N-acyltransferase